MECLPEDRILEYNPDTLVVVRKLYKLDKPGQIDEAIDLLDAWVKKQSHFERTDYSREYLERVIILLKGSVERAKSQLDKICTLRTLLPVFFEKHDVNNDFKLLDGSWYVALLPKLTKDNTRILFMRFLPDFPYNSHYYLQMFNYVLKASEYIKGHDYSDGIIIIVDYFNVNILDFVTEINIVELRQFATIFLQGYATRLKNIFILSASKAIDLLVKILGQLLSEKLRERMKVIKSIEELHERLPRELLPTDYGGDQKSLPTLHDELRETLGSSENIKYLKEMSEARTNESMRSTLLFNEEYLGMPGTFRTLNVD